MKLNRINALALTLGVALASGALFAGKADAAPNATSGITFGSTVAPSVTLTSPFGKSLPYLDGPLGPSGGPKSISSSDSATFDTNSDTVGVTSTLALTQPPTPVNATALVGVHSTTYSANGGTPVVGLANTTLPTNTDGDITITLTSTWTGGEDLLSGPYSAAYVVTVTPL